ncbi:MAG: exopolysaccharide biosynthesis polyprenyl glycosylphosphotransferase [Sphingomonas sp.]|nr:exopolysaccharide biosynthesis polyprenyl glycosylphosphotransferase [Sphingomonas sp.]
MSRISLVLADAIALTIAFCIVVLLRRIVFGSLPPLHWGLWLSLAAWFVFRALNGLDSPCGLYPPDALRRSFQSCGAAFLLHAAFLISANEWHMFRFFGLLIWPVVIPLTFTARSLVRSKLISMGRYGVPIVVVGNGIAGRRAIRELQARPELGYVPVALFSTEKTQKSEQKGIHGVPLVGRSEIAASFDAPYHVNHAILAIGGGWEDERNHTLAKQLGRRFNHLQIFSNVTGEGHWLSRARPLGAYLTIETKHARFAGHQRALKRGLDIAIAFPALILSTPIIILAGLLVYFSGPGPIFFGQMREGRQGKPIKIYKLRSMVQGAEAKLAKYLAENPAARFEYERTMKLRNDPRIIPAGKLIRKASIDELPQLWSILKGDMSLVGPRVMPTREIDLYSEGGRDLRRDMLPGLTGFWQVEHRNDSDFRIREIADSFYVANWSVWLDIWIILRTVRVLLTGAGAF